jgi:hypothetical protein
MRQCSWNNGDDASFSCIVSPEFFAMHGIIYLVGLIVIVMAILSFVGLN